MMLKNVGTIFLVYPSHNVIDNCVDLEMQDTIHNYLCK